MLAEPTAEDRKSPAPSSRNPMHHPEENSECFLSQVVKEQGVLVKPRGG